MIREFTNPSGQRVFTLTAADLDAAAAWTRAACHLAYGPDKGEEMFRSIPAKQVLTRWLAHRTTTIEA